MKKRYAVILLSLLFGMGKPFAQNFESVTKNVVIENKSLKIIEQPDTCANFRNSLAV